MIICDEHITYKVQNYFERFSWWPDNWNSENQKLFNIRLKSKFSENWKNLIGARCEVEHLTKEDPS